MSNCLYKTSRGSFFLGDSEQLLSEKLYNQLKGQVQLIFTSPPFPLNKKKRYGNLTGEEYKEWFISLAKLYSDLLKKDGSIVIEMGNAWEPERPIQSLLPLESLLGFVNNPEANLRLCQQFTCYNPSRLPSPAQWVTVNRIRTIDSYTNLWWMSKNDMPKANNLNVLRPYSKSMKSLLKKQSYNAGKRPSQHKISEKSFLKDNGGSIMPNVIEMEQIDETRDLRLPENIFSIANTNSNDYFLKTCKEKDVRPHPARMPIELAQFFIEFLTDPGDIVLDPFAGTNTTGFGAEKLKRKWVSIELNEEYGEQSKFRFQDPELKIKSKVG